jgi:pyridoxamine 5'-phosphate oxidase family protein
MSAFSDAELAYLRERRLGRLATVDARGLPHVVPLGWHYNPEYDTIDVTGRDLTRTAKFRHASANPNVALVVDDVRPPWRPRAVEVRGRAEVIPDAVGSRGEPLGALIRIHPLKVVSWGLDETSP